MKAKASVLIVAPLLLAALLAGSCSSPSNGQRPATGTPSSLPTATPLGPPSQATAQKTGELTPMPAFNKEVPFQSGDLELTAYLCKPEGPGPFPAATFNHGGKGGIIGGAPEDTCRALAEDGFVGFAPIRRTELSLEGNLLDAMAGLDYVKGLDYVDSDRIAMMGFSRGGLITFMAAEERPDLKAAVIMAGAPPAQGDAYSQAAGFTAPALILVAENDVPGKNVENQDHVALAREMADALAAAGKDVELIVYPPYEDNGHMMFFEVGEYWKDIEEFLSENLSE